MNTGSFENYFFVFQEGETMNNIIDMTKNDPDFDILFNMFRVGEYCFTH